MFQKTYKRASAFWKHGKHASVIGKIREKEREQAKKHRRTDWKSSVQELFQK